MFEFLMQHEFWAAVGAYWTFSAAVSSMPAPSVTNGAGYLWVYRFLHTLAGNITTVFGSRIPGTTLALLLTLPPFLAFAGCTAPYVVHPGALNMTDSSAYDALLIAETMIDQARTAYQAGQLPEAAKEPLNALIQSYNVAQQSWLAYRGALATKSPPDVYFSQLTTNLTNLTNAIQALKGAL